MRWARVIACLALTVAAATACSRGSKAPDCRSEQEYQSSRSGALLQTPPDITRAEGTAMRIPDVRADFDESTVGCLDRPPPYFDRPPAAAPAGPAPLPPPGPAAPAPGPAGPPGP